MGVRVPPRARRAQARSRLRPSGSGPSRSRPRPPGRRRPRASRSSRPRRRPRARRLREGLVVGRILIRVRAGGPTRRAGAPGPLPARPPRLPGPPTGRGHPGPSPARRPRLLPRVPHPGRPSPRLLAPSGSACRERRAARAGCVVFHRSWVRGRSRRAGTSTHRRDRHRAGAKWAGRRRAGLAAQKGGRRVSFTLHAAPLSFRSVAMTPFPGRAGVVAHPKVTRRPPFSPRRRPRAARAGPPAGSPRESPPHQGTHQGRPSARRRRTGVAAAQGTHPRVRRRTRSRMTARAARAPAQDPAAF